jgi:hypothetical protein
LIITSIVKFRLVTSTPIFYNALHINKIVIVALLCTLEDSMKRGMGCVGTTLFAGIFFVVGIAASYWGWTILRNARISNGWPATQGEIIASSVRADTDEDGTTYHADVTFSYVVEDHRYSSETVSFGQYGSSNRKHAEEIVRTYQPGEKVPVYYNPDEPKTAVLEPGVTTSSYMVLGIGLCFAILPAIIVPISLFRRR